MQFNYMAFVIPVFFLFMGLELLLSIRQKKGYYKFENSILNICVGIADRLMNLFVAGAFYGIFDYLHDHYAIFNIQASVFSWVFLFFLVDFIWYWYHRFGHEVNIGWSAHIVHHTSEEFNLTVSARITIFQSVFRTTFWSVLPIIGFPAPMLSVLLLIHGAYPFFLHTRYIKNLGILEWFFVTPSHHRVHHASNPQYLDKNYGDILIIWDRLFGTFAPEKEEPVYGLTKPLKSHSFLWQHFHFLLELLYATRETSGLGNKIRLLFGRPDQVSEHYRDQLEKQLLPPKTIFPVTSNLRRYVSGQLVVSILALFGLIFLQFQLSVGFSVAVGFCILLTLINCGAILEQRSWVFYLEYSRVILILVTSYLYHPHLVIPVVLLLYVAFTVVYFSRLKKTYHQVVYGLASC